MELPFVGQILQLTVPKYSKMATNSKKPSKELERKDSLKRSTSTKPKTKDKEQDENEEKKAENKQENPELEDKIQNQNHEILHKKHKEKSLGRQPGPLGQPANNLQFLLRHGDNKEKGTFQDVNLVRCCGGSKVGYFWKLWEVVLTNQPLLIVSDSPTKCRFYYLIL